MQLTTNLGMLHVSVQTVIVHPAIAPYLPCRKVFNGTPHICFVKSARQVSCSPVLCKERRAAQVQCSCSSVLHVYIMLLFSLHFCIAGWTDISHPVSIKLETLTQSTSGNLVQLHSNDKGNSGGMAEAHKHTQAPTLHSPPYRPHISSGLVDTIRPACMD